MARYYAKQYGAFLSPDPGHVGANIGDPLSWNAYVYTANDPINRTDPGGTDYSICEKRSACYTLEDSDYASLYNSQDGEAGISLPAPVSGSEYEGPIGNIFYSGQLSGTVAYFLSPAQRLSREMTRRPIMEMVGVGAAAGVVGGVGAAAGGGLWAISLVGSVMKGNFVDPPPDPHAPKIGVIFVTRGGAFRDAKTQNRIPISKQPDRVIKPGTPEGNSAGLRTGSNVRMYEFTNSSGKKIWIREDGAAFYPKDGGSQSPHFNSGPAGTMELTGHHYFQ